MKYSDNEIISMLNMSGKRLDHTIAVAKECDALAKLFALSANDAADLHVAALLHDCTKERSIQEQFELCKQYNISYSKDDAAAAKTLHAVTGAAYASDKFGANEKICFYISSHTIGRPNMSLCEKLLYLADYIEATRTFDDCVELREFFYSNVAKKDRGLEYILDKTLILSFDMTIKNLIKNGASIHPTTVSTRNSLIYTLASKGSN